MANAIISLCYRGLEFDVEVSGEVARGGSAFHGSDEPPWIEVDGVAYANPLTGKPVSARLANWITKNHYDYAEESLIEV